MFGHPTHGSGQYHHGNPFYINSLDHNSKQWSQVKSANIHTENCLVFLVQTQIGTERFSRAIWLRGECGVNVVRAMEVSQQYTQIMDLAEEYPVYYSSGSPLPRAHQLFLYIGNYINNH